MKPILSKQTPQRRSLLFGPLLVGIFLLVFLVLGFATDLFLLSLVLAIPAALAATVVLVGWPHVTRKDGRPWVEPKWRPYLFFLIAPIVAVSAYPFVGAGLTAARLAPAYLAWMSLAIVIALGCALAYFLVGFPKFWRGATESYRRVPAERRPFFFFPLFVLFFVLIYFGLGVGTTTAFTGSKLLLSIQVLIVLPVSLLLAGLGAYLLVGIPKPQRMPQEYLPKVTGRRRPQLFILTFLLLGIPLTIAFGALLSYLAGLPKTAALLPDALILPLGVVLGYSLSLGLAAIIWGTPARWRQYDDYRPGVPPRARLPLFIGTGLATALVVTVIFGVAGADIFWGLLTGALLGIIVALQLAGIMGRIAARRTEATLVPDMPDGIKPLILFPAWLLIAAVFFTVLTYTLPDLVAWNALGSLLIGLIVAFFLIEQPLWKDMIADRRREAAKRRAFQAKRKAALKELDEPKDGG